MRNLWVNGTNFEITDINVNILLKSGAIYECGEEHDLHLSPDHKYNMGEVEILMSPGEVTDYVA
jgi:hypothetical protein